MNNQVDLREDDGVSDLIDAFHLVPVLDDILNGLKPYANVEEGFVYLSQVGERLHRRIPGFKPEMYKCTTLLELIKTVGYDVVEVPAQNGPKNSKLVLVYLDDL